MLTLPSVAYGEAPSHPGVERTHLSTLDAMRFLDSASDCCVCSESNQGEIVVLDYRLGTISKTIVHDVQCLSAPPGLRELEQTIDRVSGVEGWTTGHATAQGSVQ